MKLVAFLAGFILAIPLIGDAIDVEHARLGMTATAKGGAVTESVRRTSVSSGELYQNRPIRWWARRTVQNKKDSLARGRTIRRLKRELRRGFIPDYWVKIASCESGVSWTYNGSSGFDGAVQFHPGTWSANRLRGYPAFAYQASPFQQLVVAEIVLSRSGWGQWPACSRKVGLR